MMDKTPLTQRGLQLLRDELKQLKSVERPRIVDAGLEVMWRTLLRPKWPLSRI